MKKGHLWLILPSVSAILAISAVGIFWWSVYVKTSADKQKQPLTWDECFKTPGAVGLFTYPGQCVTPDGRTVTQPVSATTPGHSCQIDYDCTLVINNSWSDCSLQNSCEPVDYSQNKWLAVNRQSFSEVSLRNCPAAMYQPLDCFPQPINVRFVAKCVNKVCQKTSLDQN